MVTQLTVFSMTLLKAEISAHVKRTFIVWLKCLRTSSIKWLRKVFHSLVNTVELWRIVHSVARKFLVHSMLAAKQVSSFCWVLTLK
ncbi:hypothetical protein D3C72_1108920 [compost metagenome]